MLDNLTFEINSRIEIAWNDEYYKSTIENVEEGFICISIPIKEGQYIPLRPGEQVEVLYYSDKDIYKFYTYAIGRRVDKIPIILLAYPKEIYKVQRRRFVRVPIVCSIEYLKIGKNDEVKALKATMVDLSGGGMRIKLREELNLGDKIIAKIPIDNEFLEVKGEIVRIEPEEDSKRIICGVSFTELEERKREKVIRFIFQVMRDQMKKGY
ncbi:PilZ domain-containing protein [Clostridium swellfunianum]|uniref:flagellar brake protein n=1 Tax=Clostridium swellfunianum TaxID=1367462 RepID=UPI00202E8FA5|nr:PilZ domain-containing protein [Clostridium swellfunianum]MCM0650433.1 PilZ domain-containing protein [Clostridium swellfunianum]